MRLRVFFLFFLVSSVCGFAQDSFRESVLTTSDRRALVEKRVEGFENLSDSDLLEIAENEDLDEASRAAAAVSILRRDFSPDTKRRVIHLSSIEMRPSVNEFESSSDPGLLYPVANQVSMDKAFVEDVVGHYIDGKIPESVSSFMLLRYQSNGVDVRGLLDYHLRVKSDIRTAQRGERMLRILRGENVGSKEEVGIAGGDSAADLDPSEKEAITERSDAQLSPEPANINLVPEEPSSSDGMESPGLPKCALVVIVVAVLGILILFLRAFLRSRAS